MSTFAFSTSIPAANNSPADDQPYMLSNNSSTSGIIAIDHVGFNTSNGGYHKQITFSANQSAPGYGTGVSDLFVNLSSSISQLFFQNSAGTVQLTGLPITSTSTGGGTCWGITTPWGLKLNFGQSVISVNSSQTITYAVAFSSTVYSTLVTLNSNAPNGSSVTVSGGSTTGITIYRNQLPAGSATVFYLSIGT